MPSCLSLVFSAMLLASTGVECAVGDRRRHSSKQRLDTSMASRRKHARPTITATYQPVPLVSAHAHADFDGGVPLVVDGLGALLYARQWSNAENSTSDSDVAPLSASTAVSPDTSATPAWSSTSSTLYSTGDTVDEWAASTGIAMPTASAGAWSSTGFESSAAASQSIWVTSDSSASPMPSVASFRANRPKPSKENESQCAVLNAIWGDMGGATWRNATGWSTVTKDCCSTAFGISCDDDGYITAIEMSDNGMSWAISSSIFNLAKLTRLDLSSNHISGVLPDQFGQLQSLSAFSVDSNSLSGPLPGSLVYAQALQTVRLGNNSFSGALQFPAALQLRELSAENNAFSSFGPINSAALTTVIIDDNDMSGTLPNVEALPKLQKFTASGCGFNGPAPDLSKLPDLQFIDLCENNLTGPIPDASLAPHLSYFAISGNSFTGMFPDAKAPSSLKTCLVDPVTSDNCPADAADKSSLAYRCHLDCSSDVDANMAEDTEMMPLLVSGTGSIRGASIGLALSSVFVMYVLV